MDGDKSIELRRRDRDVLVRRLSDVLSRSAVVRPTTSSKSLRVFRLTAAEEAEKLKEATEKGIPASLSLAALKIGNGLTPQALFDQVKKLKEAPNADTINAEAKELARRLMAPPSKLRELYRKADGTLDFDRLFRDLGLDGEGDLAKRTALRNALEEEEPVAPLDEEGKEEQPGPTDENNGDGTGGTPGDDGFIDLGANGNGDGFFNPAEGELGDEFLDELADPNDLIEDNVNDDNNNGKNQGQNANPNAQGAAKDGKNGKNGGAGKAPGSPPPPSIPPSFPPISGAGSGGGGGDKGQPLPLPEMPQVPEMPPFQMPPPPQESGLSPELMLALLGSQNKTGERPPDTGMSDMLKAFAEMNQQTINTILQLGTALMANGAARSQITVASPQKGGTPNVSSQGSNMAARLQGFSGSRTSSRTAPRTGRNPSGAVGTATTQATPRDGQVPGYDRARTFVKPGKR